MKKAALVISSLLVLASVPGRAEDKFLATITADNQKVAFTHGLAWIDAKGVISIGLYNAAPNAKEEARALAGGGNIFGVFDVPNVQLDLDFDKAPRADLAAFSSCHVGFREFSAGIFDWNAFKGGCGPVEFSGDLKPGGVVHGKLKGRAEGFPTAGHAPVYTWDVDFTVTLRAKS
jgi:hypothetical protein